METLAGVLGVGSDFSFRLLARFDSAWRITVNVFGCALLVFALYHLSRHRTAPASTRADDPIPPTYCLLRGPCIIRASTRRNRCSDQDGSSPLTLELARVDLVLAVPAVLDVPRRNRRNLLTRQNWLSRWQTRLIGRTIDLARLHHRRRVTDAE